MSPAAEKILYENEAFRLTDRRLVEKDGTVAELVSSGRLVIDRQGQRREIDIPAPSAGEPGYCGNIPVLTALYNLALHELKGITTAEGQLRAGASWEGVWTRDVAYAAALGGALAAPLQTRLSLEARVRGGLIMQDTGTGGGWPVSTDRVVWAIGAWTLYCGNGDREWLEYAARVLEATLAQDDAVLLRPLGLYPGETSFIDWREQSYPNWMTTADIGAGYALGTNVLHYVARNILARMYRVLGQQSKAEVHAAAATELAQSIGHHFWNRATHSFSMLITGDACSDNRTDSLATALTVISGIAGEYARQAMDALPRSPYGTPVFAPYKCSIPQSYHNRAVWPFVEAFVLMAHAELLDTAGLQRSLACLLRAAMAFGTNKENFNAATGAADGTVQNSDSQLWSICGMLGAFYYGLFGISYDHGELVFSPCVPKSFGGSHWLTGLHIRNMVLSVHINGYGTEIASCLVNGKPASPMIPLDTVGNLQIELELLPDGSEESDSSPGVYPTAREDLPEPQWDSPDSTELRWHPVAGAGSYCVYANGRALTVTAQCRHAISPCRHGCDSYRIQAIGPESDSCLSAPFENPAPGSRHLLQPHRIGEQAEYAVQHRQAWLDTRPCTSRLDYERIFLPAGTYNLRFLYCNASASKRDGDTCALRELQVDGVGVGVVSFPHNTEMGQWEHYTLSAPLTLTLPEGLHRFSLCYTARCTNGNGEHNACMVRYLEITQMESCCSG